MQKRSVTAIEYDTAPTSSEAPSLTVMGKDGGEEVGDKRIRARSLIIEFSIAKQKRQEYASLFNQLISFF